MTEGNAHAGALRTSLAECVSEVRMPDGLLDRAVARNRKRTARNRLISAAGTAAVAVTGVAVIISVPGQQANRQVPAQSTMVPRVQTAAYILQRAAVAEVNSYRMISVSQGSGNGTVYTDLATQQQRIDSDVRASTGGPYVQLFDVVKGGVWTETTIDRQHHVYSIQTDSAKYHDGTPKVTISSYLPLQDKPDPGVSFQAALKQGIITVVGHRNLGGRDTILLSVKPPTKLGAVKLGYPVSKQPRDEIWVDASTYLVVQTEHFPSAIGKTGKPAYSGTAKGNPVITRVSWLRATPGNLAELAATPPLGYTHVSHSDMGKYLASIS